YAVPPPTPQPNYSSTYTIIQQPATTTSVVVVGGCPACSWWVSLTESVFPFCRVGVLEDTFTCLGVLCAIVFFPIGILFCLALRQRRCPNCGAAFG
ncbi:PREDICTED: brain protein I3, partial [Acanthisitta chloris]|uniref:brain protein I3 n=1 Tax=Acanthisitta chloris TaxID=57068 RepID=UPI0004F0EA00